MTARIQTFRSSTTGTRPSTTRPVGELFVNLADNALGVMDATPAPRDLLPIRYHAATAQFAAGDLVANAGRLYRTKAAIAPKAFAPADWIGIGSDVINVLDFGAKLDGTTNDTAAWAASRAAAMDYGTIVVPRGRQFVNTAPTGGPATPVLWQYDGDYLGSSGTTPVTGMGTDTVETFIGSKFFGRANTSTTVTSPVVRIDSTVNHTGGVAHNTVTALRINATPTSSALEDTLGVAAVITSTKPSGGNLVAVTGYSVVSPSGRNHASFGGNISATDNTGLKSSASGISSIGIEFDVIANDDDDAGGGNLNFGVPAGQGQRVVVDVVGAKANTSGPDVVVGWGVRVGPTSGNLGISFRRSFAAYGPFLKSAFSTEFAVQQPGAHAIWLGNEHHIALNTSGSNYLQYTTTGTPRLRYMAGATEAFSINNTGQMSGPGFGWDIGDIPGPIVSQGGISALKPSAELIFQRNAFAATDGQDFRFRRITAFTGGTSSNINKCLEVEFANTAGNGCQEWPFLVKAMNSSTSGGMLVSAYIQAWRNAGNGLTTGLITDVADFQGTPSSTSGQLTGMEWDLNATGADDGANSSRFGGIGIRQMAHAVFANMSSTVNSQYTAGIWFGTGINGTAKAYVDSLLCVQGGAGQPTLIRNFLDSRGAQPPPGVTDPVAAVRTSAGHIIDLNGGPALNSPPGRYLQYTTTGTARLRYMLGTAEALWVDDAANMAVAGTLSATNFSTPGTLNVANVIATGTVTGQTLHATQDLTVDRNAAVTGGLGVNGSITSAISISAASQLSASGGAMVIGSGGNGRIMQMQGGYYFDFNTSTGDTQWLGNNAPLWVMRASDGASYNGTAWVGGHGAYRDVSDERLKIDITPATVGLPEILAIDPINFHRLSADGQTYPADEIGFSAQNVQPIIPEAVTVTGIGLPDALAVASEMILAAAVNAIKTLNDRVVALEAT